MKKGLMYAVEGIRVHKRDLGLIPKVRVYVGKIVGVCQVISFSCPKNRGYFSAFFPVSKSDVTISTQKAVKGTRVLHAVFHCHVPW